MRRTSAIKKERERKRVKNGVEEGALPHFFSTSFLYFVERLIFVSIYKSILK